MHLRGSSFERRKALADKGEEIGGLPAGPMIYICDKCLQASCWAGIFMCWESREAGLYRATRPQLRKLAREHPSYWQREEVKAPRSDTRTPLLPNRVVRDSMPLEVG